MPVSARPRVRLRCSTYEISAPATVTAHKPADFASADGSPEHGDDEEAYAKVASAAADGFPEEADDGKAYFAVALATVPPETAGSN